MFTSNEPLTIEQIARLAPSAMALSAHQSRSTKYHYIPTIDVIQRMMEQGFLPYTAHQSLAKMEDRKAYTKHMIRFRKAGLEFNVGDTLPEIVLVNSHDGTSSYQLMGGLFRKVCANGMVVSESTISMVRIPHHGNISDKVIEGSYRIIEDSNRALTGVAHWSQLQLTLGEQELFANTARVLRFGDANGTVHNSITAQQLLAPRRSADTGSNLWSIFNRVQENIIRGGLRGRSLDDQGIARRRFRTREINSIDTDVKLNRQLWALGEQFAKQEGTVLA